MFKLVTTITVNRRISSHWVHCRITKQTPYTFSGAVMSLFISEILKSWIQNSIIISLWRKISINSPLRWFFFFLIKIWGAEIMGHPICTQRNLFWILLNQTCCWIIIDVIYITQDNDKYSQTLFNMQRISTTSSHVGPWRSLRAKFEYLI